MQFVLYLCWQLMLMPFKYDLVALENRKNICELKYHNKQFNVAPQRLAAKPIE